MKPTRDELHQLYEKDLLSLEAIGQRYGVSRKLVTRWLKEAGIAIRKAKRAHKIDAPPAETLRKLRADGLSLDEVAQRFGVARTTAHRWCKDLPPTVRSKEKAAFVAYHREQFLLWLETRRENEVA